MVWVLCVTSVIAAPHGKAQVLDLAEPVRQTEPSIVGIMRFDHDSAVPSNLVGTGFVINEGRHVITNAHVVRKSREKAKGKTAYFALAQPAGTEKSSNKERLKRYRLQMVDKADAYDLALLTFQDQDLVLPALKIINTEALVPAGRAVFSIGFPIGGALGPFPAVSSGIISAITPSLSPQMHASQLDPAFIRQRRYALYQLDMTAYPGQSGSPLLNALTNEVVGVVNATKVKKDKERVLSDPSGISYAITASELRTFLLRNGIVP